VCSAAAPFLGERSTMRNISPLKASAAARDAPGCAVKRRASSSAGHPIRSREARSKSTTGRTRSRVATERSRRYTWAGAGADCPQVKQEADRLGSASWQSGQER
jgi:hypothetical protein